MFPRYGTNEYKWFIASVPVLVALPGRDKDKVALADRSRDIAFQNLSLTTDDVV